MSRNYDSFLYAYKDYIVKQESPPMFHLWVGLTMISATVKRNIWINRKAYIIYPNLYTILVAKTASCRKSVSMNIGLDLISENKKIKTVHERTTVEGLTDLMNRVEASPSGKIRPDGSVLLHADELGNMFSRKTYVEDLVTFLTAAFTANAKLDFLTRGKGFVQVRNPCPVLLAGTTPSQFGDIFPASTLELGFLGRTLIITGERGQRIADPYLNTKMREPLIQDLEDMSYLEGEMKVTEKCDKVFKEWYEDGAIGDSPTTELEPYYQRKHDHVLKCAMLLSVSESNDMVVTEDHFWTAVKLLESIEGGMSEILERVGSAIESHMNDLALEILRKTGIEMSHSVLFRRMHRRCKDSAGFASIIDSLVQMDKIDVISSKRGVFYKYKPGKKMEVNASV
jgi:hypothetical protein